MRVLKDTKDTAKRTKIVSFVALSGGEIDGWLSCHCGNLTDPSSQPLLNSTYREHMQTKIVCRSV
jgi:hypothetical protein